MGALEKARAEPDRNPCQELQVGPGAEGKIGWGQQGEAFEERTEGGQCDALLRGWYLVSQPEPTAW